MALYNNGIYLTKSDAKVFTSDYSRALSPLIQEYIAVWDAVVKLSQKKAGSSPLKIIINTLLPKEVSDGE